ncbi:MAG: hypothetical protein FJ149_05005 [Euryarchaeota archaeon]|nr:hypothetical protein [Euryarchaeota archaeon]
MKVKIRRQWNDWRVASVDIGKITSLHWDVISGGIGGKAIRPFIMGYVWCDDVEGELAHSCMHGSGPHHIKVTVVKKDNDRVVWDAVLKATLI